MTRLTYTAWDREGKRLVTKELPMMPSPLRRQRGWHWERGQAAREYAMGMIASTVLLVSVVALLLVVS